MADAQFQELLKHMDRIDSSLWGSAILIGAAVWFAAMLTDLHKK